MHKTLYKIQKKTNPNDVFITPLELVKLHCDLVHVNENDVIYDPFFGTGNYYNSFKNHFKQNTFLFSEITLGKDFFEFDEKIDVIISNPPYSCIDNVLTKSIQLNPHTISYLIGINNLTTKRIEYMNHNGYGLTTLHFTKVYSWFGMSIIVIFTKDGDNCISFDRKVHREVKI
jgi:type I restriction-modification system DNA methylase subunit